MAKMYGLRTRIFAGPWCAVTLGRKVAADPSICDQYLTFFVSKCLSLLWTETGVKSCSNRKKSP